MDMKQYNLELSELNSKIVKLRLQKRELEEEVKDQEEHMKEFDDDKIVGKQLEENSKKLNSIKEDINFYANQASDIRKTLDTIVSQQYREELEAEAAEYHFDIPNDDPVVHCLMLSAIAENLQYQFISGKPYFHRLIDRVHNREQEDGSDKGYTDEDALNPEINYDDIARLDDMRNRRRYIQMLRLTIEREFNLAMEAWPPDVNFTPKLLRRNDAELEAYLDGLKAKRANRRKQQARQVAQAEHKLAEQEDQAYTGD